ncbi:MAG: ArsR family transcriptional regulator [Chloroflexota bacterium]
MGFDSRQRILEHLKKSGQASVAELSEAVSLTPVTIRHHLERLRSEGLVSKPVARRKPGPGRPEMVYRSTPAADTQMPRNYGELCRCLLQKLQAPSKEQDLEAVLVEVGTELGARETVPAGSSRLRYIQRYLEDRGYFPNSYRAEGGLRVELANCPYLEVARTSPALCHFDRALLAALFGKYVEMGGRIVEKQPVCTFSIAD